MKSVVRYCCTAIGVFALLYAGGCCIVRTSADDSLNDAEELLKRRAFGEARESLKLLLWFDPENARALLLTGATLNGDRRFPESIAVLRQIPEDSDQFVAARAAMVSSLIHDGQYETAEAILLDHLKRNPNSRFALERLTWLYETLNRVGDLRQFWTGVLPHSTDAFGILHYLLRLEVQVTVPEWELGTLERADVRHSGQASVVLALAQSYAQMGRTDEARRRFREAVRIRPDDMSLCLTAAEFHFENGDLDAAERLIDGRSPDSDAQFWLLQGRIAAAKLQTQRALTALQMAARLDSGDVEARLAQVPILRQLGRDSAADETAREAHELAKVHDRLFELSKKLTGSPDVTVWREIGVLLDGIGRHEQAAGWRWMCSQY